MGFTIDFLDHVALRVRNLETSVAWYEKVLGLKKLNLPEWGAYPIFMMTGKTGVALFPAGPENDKTNADAKYLQIDHFAFQVSRGNFEKARKHYDALKLDYYIEDHIYFHSIYTRDPDGHKVELTTPVKDEASIYTHLNP